MNHIVGDVNKSRRQSSLNIVIAGRIHRDCLTGGELQQDIQSWLSPPDPSINHKIACELRHTGTTLWFTQGDTFSEWKWSKTSSLLWINGKRSLFPALSAIAETDGFCSCSGRREEYPLVCGLLDFLFALRTYCVG